MSSNTQLEFRCVSRNCGCYIESRCDEAMADFEKHPRYEALRAKMDSLEGQLKESQGKLKMEEAKISGYKTQVTTLESKCTGLEAERARLVEKEVKLCQEMDGLKLECKSLKNDRAEVVSKVVPYVAMEFYHSDELGAVVGKLVNAAIFYGKCTTLEEIAETKKPVVFSEVPYYRPNSEHEYNEAGNAYTTAEYPFLAEATKDPSASIKYLLSKKPRKIQPPSPTKRTPSMKLPSPSQQEDLNSSKNV